MTKKRLRENYVLKPERKIESEVFDRETLKILSKLIRKGIIDSVDYPISTGKEANVFRGASGEKYVAIKIYKTETSPFFRREEYLEGDPRFKKIKNTDREVIIAFARKEFKNLQICESAGVHAPKPFYIEKNVLVMSFLGEGDLPYPTLTMVDPRGEQDLESILEDIRKMYKAGLVHADISEYNVMLGDVPWLIDFGQGVVTRHLNAEKFLERDVLNILRYFEKKGYKKDFEETMKWIRK
jgi:RIO kinase 1